MSLGDYYSYLTDFPHLVLTFTIGFLTLFFFLPLYLIFIYSPSDSISYFMVFPYYWKNILVTWSQINPVFFFILLIAFSYLAGFIFIGLYDLFAKYYFVSILKILNFISKKRKKNGYSTIILEAKKTIKDGKRFIGTSDYSKFQFRLYHKDNRNIQAYLNWEFIKCVSCGYLSFLIILTLISSAVFHYVYMDDIIVITNIEIFVFLGILIIALPSLMYGYLFYGSARYKGEVEAYNELM